MFEPLIKKLLERRSTNGEVTLSVPGSKERVSLSKEKFELLKEEPFSGKSCFVDGGNAAIFDSSGARVEFVRFAALIYNGEEKIATRREEGFLLIRVEEEQIAVEGLGLELSIDQNDSTLSFGKENVTLATVANLARFMLECRFAKKIAEKEGCKLIIRDGTLQGMNTYEEEELAKLLDTKLLVAGIAKTNTLLASDGRGATSILEERAPEEAWQYPLTENISLVKLHSSAAHLFRLDGSKNIAKYLLSQSKDPVFPGYPYPLIMADRLARVSNREQELLTTRFMMEAGSDWKALRALVRSKEAHELLDSIA